MKKPKTVIVIAFWIASLLVVAFLIYSISLNSPHGASCGFSEGFFCEDPVLNDTHAIFTLWNNHDFDVTSTGPLLYKSDNDEEGICLERPFTIKAGESQTFTCTFKKIYAYEGRTWRAAHVEFDYLEAGIEHAVTGRVHIAYYDEQGDYARR